MTEIDDPDVLRREIRTMLERVTDRGSLIFFQWLVRRVLANYPITFGVLVAFSGTVTSEEQKYTEENMPPRRGRHRRGVQESRPANSGCGKQIANGIRPTVTAHYVCGQEARRL
jgi:hypothetical protein